MRYGKLTEAELKDMLSKFTFSRGEIVKGACIGSDTGVVRCDEYITVTADPITAYVDNMGALAVDVNSNDIYASGAEPFAAVLTVLSPPDLSVDEVVKEVISAYDAAKEKGIAIIGGHTEFTDAVNRLIISVAMLGKTKKPFDNTKIRPGDKVIVTKSLGLEGAKIMIDNDYRCAVNLLSIDEMSYIQSQSLSVDKEAVAVSIYTVGALHDITEGGVAGAAAELAANTPYGIRIYERELPVSSGVRKLAEAYNIDVNYLISSGSMMIITPDSRQIQYALSRLGIESCIIGEVIDGESVIVRYDGRAYPLSVKTDEIYKFLNR